MPAEKRDREACVVGELPLGRGVRWGGQTLSPTSLS